MPAAAGLKPCPTRALRHRRHTSVLASLTLTLAVCATFWAGTGARPYTSDQSPRYGVGRTPTPEEIRAWDIAISPDGRELPEGRGTAAEGKAIYAARCASCHGATGKEGPHDVLVGGRDSLTTSRPLKTIGSYWPYATTLWDYVNRAMPFERPETLPPDQVYATVAYLLFINGIVREDDVMDAASLPKVRMPNRDRFVPDPRPDVSAHPKLPKP